MALFSDERAQSIQVGAVLLFAILILVFSTYQAVIVPEQNRRVEFDHNQEVQSQLSELRDDVIATQDGGRARSATVDLGTRYPSRALALNPSPPAGTLRTVGTTDPAFNITIRNATAGGETGDYWDGSVRRFDTGALTYEPLYHRYENAPTTAYEHTVLYNDFDADALVLANQSFVRDTDLSLVTLNGSIERTSSTATTVDTRPLSSSDRTILVGAPDPDSPIVLNFTSGLSADRWRTILAEEEHVESVTGFPSAAGDEFTAIRVELNASETYELAMTKAGVGTGLSGEGPAYLTDVSGDGASVARGNSQQLILEVRDAYNNPVRGVTVNGSVDGSNAGSLDSSQETTGSDGRVTFTYRTTGSTATGTHAVNVTMDDAAVLSSGSFDAASPTNATMEVTVTTAAGGGGGPYSLAWEDPSGQSGVDCPGGPDDVCMIDGGQTSSVTLTTGTSPVVSGASLDYALNESTRGSLDPEEGVTDENGENQTTLTVTSNGGLDVFVTGGGASDTITFAVSNFVEDLVYNGDATAEDGPDGDATPGGVEFTVTNQFSQDVTFTEMTINETGGPVSGLSDEVSPNDQSTATEIYLEGDLNEGWVDYGGGTALPVTADLDSDGIDNNGNPELSSGGTMTVYLYEFENNGGNRVDMSGQSFSVTFDYQLENGTVARKKMDITVP